MKVQVSQEELERVVKRATLSSGASPNPIHLLVKLEAKKAALPGEVDSLILTGTSGLMSINTSVKADVSQPGVICTNAKKLGAAAAAMSSGAVTLSVSGPRVKLKASSGRTWSGSLTDEKLQPVPEPEGQAWLRLPVDAARVALERVKYGTTNMTDECRAYDGVRFEAERGLFRAACISRYNCIVFDQKPEKDYEQKVAKWQATLPTICLPRFEELLAECEREEQKFIDLYEDGRFVSFVGPCTLLVAALPIGDYPPYELVISNFPKEPFCTFPRLALMESLKACLATRDSLDSSAMLRVAEGNVTVYRNDKGGSEFSETIALPAARPNTDIRFKVDLRFLFDLLKAADSDTSLVIGQDGNQILARTDGGYTALLSLLNMDADDRA